MKYGRELLKGSTDCLLLSIIKQQPMYGYQLIQELAAKSQGYFRLKEGTIYPALHRLERDGLISGRWTKNPAGQERRYYYITEKGERILAEKMVEWHGFSKAVNLIIRPSTHSFGGG